MARRNLSPSRITPAPSIPRRRHRLRELLLRLRERPGRKNGRRTKREARSDRQRKRRTALAMSASVMAMNTGMMDPSGASQPVMSIETIEAHDPWSTRRPASDLSVSDEFKRALIEEEGMRTTVYRDVAGYPTVGVGHLVTPTDRLKVGDRVSKARIRKMLEKDLRIAEEAVARLVGKLPLYQYEFDALVDLVFNVGEGNVAPDESPRLNAAIEQADYEAIASELDYRHAAGRIANGLVYRSDRRAKIFMEANYENPRSQT